MLLGQFYCVATLAGRKANIYFLSRVFSLQILNLLISGQTLFLLNIQIHDFLSASLTTLTGCSRTRRLHRSKVRGGLKQCPASSKLFNCCSAYFSLALSPANQPLSRHGFGARVGQQLFPSSCMTEATLCGRVRGRDFGHMDTTVLCILPRGSENKPSLACLIYKHRRSNYSTLTIVRKGTKYLDTHFKLFRMVFFLLCIHHGCF